MVARGEARSPEDYTSIFVSWLSRGIRFLRTDAGKHIFEGGVLSALGLPIIEGPLVLVSFNFRDATPRFLDELLRAATSESATCTMHISLKWDGDFSDLEERVRKDSSDFSKTEEGNFSATLKLRGQMVRVNAYPPVKRLTLECNLGRWSGVPSALIGDVLEGKKSPSILKRIFGGQ